MVWRVICLVIWLCPVVTQARHIIGGELTMRALGRAGYFRIQMDQYWNEQYSNNLNNEATLTLYVYSKRGPALVQTLTLSLADKTPVVYNNAACAQTQSLRTNKGTYYRDVQFDPTQYTDPDGYYMIWERCCRDNAITNLANPVDIGMAFYLEFPAMTRSSAAFLNSSPVFGQPNGEYICINKPTSFAYAATDADGDQLRYLLVTPFQGYTTSGMTYGTSTPKATYPLVAWGSGFGATNAIPGNPALQINAQTGQLTVRANRAGYYLFGVQCDEYRNGERIGSIRRDFVLPVVDCNLTPLPVPVIQVRGQPLPDLLICPGGSATVNVEADSQWAYQWRLDGSNIDGAMSASLVVQKAGEYTVVRSRAGKCANDTLSQPLQVRLHNRPAVAADSVGPVCASAAPLTLAGQPANGVWTGPGVSASAVSSTVVSGQFSPTVAGPGLHRLTYTITDANGCQNAATRWANVSPPLRLDGPSAYRIPQGQTAQLLLLPSEVGTQVRWSPPTYLDDAGVASPMCSPLDSQTYTVEGQTTAGCSATMTVLVSLIEKIHVPNAFTPNGDFENDTWQVSNLDGYPDCDVRVYDRWGELVYHCAGTPTEPWNGTYRNIPVVAGVYTYLIQTAPDQPKLRGSVRVVR